mmetsp:Transcript_7831/g.13130  ORF Transcript_7831/g.13130 Transcript_7831/m.13130 type:complete len:403 (-) Transcript_7831:59-1267(-)
MEEVDSDDSDAEHIKQLISQDQEGESEEGEDDLSDEEGEAESEPDSEDDAEMVSDSEEEGAGSEKEEKSEASSSEKKQLPKKRTLNQRIQEEKEIRQKEQRMRAHDEQPQSIEDFERLLVSKKEESYLWIQYMAFMLDNVDLEAARDVANRAVKSVGMANEKEKLNVWTALMNLESNFGKQETLEECTRRALEVNDRKKVYTALIDIYKSSQKFEYVEAIFKQLAKKFHNSLDVWASYLEYLIETKKKKESDSQLQFLLQDLQISEPKAVLQRALQALSKDQHVNIISKFGILEFKHGSPENGRTMFEGIITNYAKRMDIWAIYMDMEIKYGQGNVTQARHLFERCLAHPLIQKKPKKMKLAFQKYMEFESQQGNKKNLELLKERVEEYLAKAYGGGEDNSD